MNYCYKFVEETLKIAKAKIESRKLLEINKKTCSMKDNFIKQAEKRDIYQKNILNTYITNLKISQPKMKTYAICF